MHREVTEIQHAVQIDEELVERTVVLLKNLFTHAIEAVADVGLALEDMMEDIDNVRLTVFIIICVDSILLTLDEVFEHEFATLNHCLREHRALFSKILVDIVQCVLPFFLATDNVHANAEEADSRFYHQRQRQLIRIK